MSNGNAPQYPAGRYRLKTTGAALGETTNGKPQIELNVEILGYYDPADGQFYPSSGERTIFLTLTDATLGTPAAPGWVYEQLLDLGWPGRSFSDLANLAGHERDGECKHEEYDGKVRDKWSMYRLRRGVAQRPLPPAATQSLDRKFAGLLKQAANQQRLATTTHEDVAGPIEEAAATAAPMAPRGSRLPQPGATPRPVSPARPPAPRHPPTQEEQDEAHASRGRPRPNQDEDIPW